MLLFIMHNANVDLFDRGKIHFICLQLSTDNCIKFILSDDLFKYNVHNVSSFLKEH